MEKGMEKISIGALMLFLYIAEIARMINHNVQFLAVAFPHVFLPL